MYQNQRDYNSILLELNCKLIVRLSMITIPVRFWIQGLPSENNYTVQSVCLYIPALSKQWRIQAEV